jgi:hypothetical protein
MEVQNSNRRVMFFFLCQRNLVPDFFGDLEVQYNSRTSSKLIYRNLQIFRENSCMEEHNDLD